MQIEKIITKSNFQIKQNCAKGCFKNSTLTSVTLIIKHPSIRTNNQAISPSEFTR